ncbi:hypothetical protein N7467_000623 [Penicillium canescens]|nr:hypothetical protein N7467_000623 [Penicillium canescens]
MTDVQRIGFTQLLGENDTKDRQYRVNIILVHCLRGHPRGTWEAAPEADRASDTAEPGKQKPRRFWSKYKPPNSNTAEGSNKAKLAKGFWPQDFLTRDIPEARVWTYGYNADIIEGIFQSNNQNSISQHGQDLAVCFKREINNKGAIAANIAIVTLQDPNKKIVQALEPNSEVLDNIHKDFKNIITTSKIKIHSFREARGMTGFKGLHNKVVDSFSAKLDLPSDMADSRYKKIAGVLKHFIHSDHIPIAQVSSTLSSLVQKKAEGTSEDVSNEPGKGPTGNVVPYVESEISTIFDVIIQGDFQAVKRFLRHFGKESLNATWQPQTRKALPLHFAAMLGKTEVVRLLLQNGSNPVIRAGTGDTTLHFAVRQDHINTVCEILKRDEYGQLLYPPKDSINWIMPEGATALTFAVYNESVKMVQLLLDAGADPDVCGSSGVTPLLTAASRSLDNILVILLDAGANPNSATVEGITPIHAVNTSRSAQNLIAAGSDLSAKVHKKNKYNFLVGTTPLRAVVDNGKPDIVKVLARSCTREQFHVKASDGKSALEATIRPYRPELSSILMDALEDLSTYG